MNYNQRDLVWLNHNPPLPDGKDLNHPILIISNSSSNSKEGFFTGVMCTSSSHKDQFTFALTKEMFEGHYKEGCQARLYILTSFRLSQIKKWENRMNLCNL